MVANNIMWPFALKLIQIKPDAQFSYSAALVILQVLKSYMWLMTTILDPEKCFYHPRKSSMNSTDLRRGREYWRFYLQPSPSSYPLFL
jgi:hypothetical protein